jgi:hypothetical protein
MNQIGPEKSLDQLVYQTVDIVSRRAVGSFWPSSINVCVCVCECYCVCMNVLSIITGTARAYTSHGINVGRILTVGVVVVFSVKMLLLSLAR